MTKVSSRGFILGTMVVLLPIMTIMVVGLIVALRAGGGSSQSYYARTASLCVAEAGLADAMGELEGNPIWALGFNAKPMKGAPGTYTVTFNQGAGPFTADQSVNNSDGTHPDSYRGANTVPTGATLLVVVARVNGVERRLEALVAPQTASLNLDNSLLTTGRIRLDDDIRIDGIQGLDDSTTVDGDLQSNNDDDLSSGVITWGGSGTLNIDGKVSSSGSSGSTINMGSGTVTGGTHPNAAPVAIPRINIPAQIAAKSSNPAPTIVPFGVTTVSSGDYYVAGDLTLDGDLQLDDGNLYVAGKLTVNGSVSGTGSVFVGSDTSIHGNADMNGQNNLALFSKGNVELRGFDGTQYLQTLASGNTTLTTWLDDTKWALQTMESGTQGGWAASNGNYLDNVTTVLGGYQSGMSPPGGRTLGAPWQLRDHLTNNVAAGPTRDFLIARLDKIGRIYAANVDTLGRPDSVAIANYNATGDTDGLFDAVNDLNQTALMDAVYNTTRAIDYNHLGNAFFQGLVYTNGSFYAGGEISVRGAVVVNDDGSQASTTIDGNTVDPGDLVLAEGCDITFVKQFFDGTGTPIGSGAPAVVLWMGR
ncbi:MAG: hypothetical protein KC910_09300 [Candidatus Eremiobacteraeota bacterium]|nr:hypothetical protein [Candidatus Eremiobacteraeota bacterium]